MPPRYNICVLNRTDLTGQAPAPAGQVNTGGNLSVSYNGAKKPYISEDFPPQNYQGETIPPFAVMRVLTNPVRYKKTDCFLVCRPDDKSMALQVPGLHFINGPAPIPLGRRGMATSDLPAPVLVDLTSGVQAPPYGNLSSAGAGVTGQPKTATGAAVLGMFVGYISGSWAVQPASDILNASSQGTIAMLKLGATIGPGGSGTTVVATSLPYAILGQRPVDLTGKKAGQGDSPTIEWTYSGQVMWVGTGALGFGSVG